MVVTRHQKIFGVGPLGALLSLLLAVLGGIDHLAGRPEITAHPGLLHRAAVGIVLAGIGPPVWSFMTLRNWWQDVRLCTEGSFRWVRHPM